MTRLKITKLDKKSLGLIDKVKKGLFFRRLWLMTAFLGMAVFNVSCSDDKSAESMKEEKPAVSAVSKEATPPTPSAVKEVCLYEHKDYQGWEKCFTSDLPKFTSLGINDQVSSLKVKGGAEARLFQHENYEGFERVYNSDTPWVGADNDQFSSLKVK